MLALLALAGLAIGLARSSTSLLLTVDGETRRLRTRAATVEAALRQAGVELYPEDRVSPTLDSALALQATGPGGTSIGQAIQIQRAQPVAVDADGSIRSFRTHATTVGQFLQEIGLQVGPADEVWLGGQLVSAEAPLTGTPETQSNFGSPEGHLGSGTEVDVQQRPLLVLRRAASLTLDDGGVRRLLHTTAATVGQVLYSHQVTLYLGDQVTPGLQERVRSGMEIVIDRSIPVTIQVDGRRIQARSRAQDVAGLLGQEQIALLGRDRVEPPLHASLQPNLVVRVTRVSEAFDVEFEAIPFEMIWIGDPELEIDRTQLVEAGQTGLNKQRYRVIYEDGREVERSLEDAWAERPPITKTLAYGTKIVVRTAETPDGPIEYWRKMRVYTVSYTAAQGAWPRDHPRYGYTRLGWKLTKGIVAVDPTVIPLRTQMYVPGYGLAIAGDTGGGVKGKMVDLGFEEGAYESWHWWTDIYLLTPVPARHTIRWVLPDWPRYPDRQR
jgi:resuscitation-promoting factor RpfB